MQRRILSVLLACTLLLAGMQAAHAASYIVTPFKVNGAAGYSYLGKAIPPMLSSRLFWQGKYEPVAGQDAVLQGNAPAGRADAEKVLKSSRADYVVWGSVTVMGNEASLDVSALDIKGKLWQQAFKSPVNNLLGGVQNAADAISSQLFGRSVAAAPAAQSASPMNRAFMMNETQGGGVYGVNPQLRYENMDGERIRSQMLDFESIGMEVADFDGDGDNEIALLNKDAVLLYRWQDGRMVQISELRLPAMMRIPLLIRSLPDGKRTLMLVTAYDDAADEPVSQLFTFQDGAFKEASSRVKYYLNVLNMAPSYKPRLVGQDPDRTRVVRGDIYDVTLRGNKLTKGSKYSSLPREANVFNMVWIPGNAKSGGDYLVAVGAEETLLTFDRNAKRLARSDESFTGTSVGIPISRGMPGLGKSTDEDGGNYYYVPMRMIVDDPDHSGTPVLITGKPISAASMLFKNFRVFPQGEIHAMFWDGLGLDLKWKTRRIKGSVVDVSVSDPNNDGVQDLVVSVNSYPGSLGMGKIRNMVLLYPLGEGK